MAKTRLTKAELVKALDRADRAHNTRVETIKADMRSLRKDRDIRVSDLQNMRIALSDQESQNERLRQQFVALEAEHQRQLRFVQDESETEQVRMEGRLEGQREAFLATIELILQSA